MRKKLFLVLPLFLVMAQGLFAQEKTVTGTVTGEAGMPLAGVNIAVKGTSQGTQTDFDGNYSISVAEGQTLVFSYLGFQTAEYAVGPGSVIDVTLSKDTAQLTEVIVLGYTSKSVDEVTGSSVQLGGEEIAEVPVPTFTEALQGKVAGLQISSSSGTPGSVQDIRIRGITSLTANNDPLYVINGVPVPTSNISGSANRTTFSPLASINKNNIESITILKDAAATAAYGARGANGVIVITTKDGKSGDTVFTFSSSIGVKNDAYNKREVLTGPQKLMLLKESLVNSYGANGSQGDFGFTTDNALQLGVNFGLLSPAILDYNNEIYDWSGDIKNEDAFIKNFDFSASGGGEKGSFYASLGFNKTEATVISTDFERVNGAFSFNQELRDNVDFSMNLSASNVKQNPILERGSFFANPYITRYLMSPFNPIYNEDGTYNIDLPFGPLPNIFYVLENDYNRNMLTRIISNSQLDWELFDNLVFSNTFAIDYQWVQFKSYANRHEGDGVDENGTSLVFDTNGFNYVYQSSLNYNFELGEDHNFDITALFEYQKDEFFQLQGFGENFPVDGLRNIASASEGFTAFSAFNDIYNVSYLALASYNFARKYVLDLTYRREGSSRFAKGKRFGDFGAVGAAWNMHMEDFMQDTPFSQLRLRGSYGLTGNSGIGINQYQAFLGYGASYNGNGAAIPTVLGNTDLTWEKNEILDFGVDFGLFDNKLTGSFAYYNRRTYDLLYSVPLSLTTSFPNQFINVGEMTNKGFEVELSYDIIETENFSWGISGNYSTVENEVTKLPIGPDGETIDRFSGGVYKTDKLGIPSGSWFMRTWAGVDPATGAPTWYLNGVDGEVTSNYNDAERVVQGSPLPTYSGGFGTHIQYKGFFADASVYFAGGHKIYEQFAQFYLRTNAFTLRNYNGAQELQERWQEPGDVTDVPRLDFAANNNFHATSSRHLYDGDYVRLKNVSLGYNLPQKYAESIGLVGLTITLRGSNLATWVKDDGLKLDPEVRADGYTRLATPPTKAYTIGINAKF